MLRPIVFGPNSASRSSPPCLRTSRSNRLSYTETFGQETRQLRPPGHREVHKNIETVSKYPSILKRPSFYVIYDPGSFYGHHEYDLGIAGMFVFSSDFVEAYHEIIPKEAGFEKRHKLWE
jgi:hypothetical protein